MNWIVAMVIMVLIMGSVSSCKKEIPEPPHPECLIYVTAEGDTIRIY